VTPAPKSPDDKFWSGDIRADNSITDRCLRKWVELGRFPAPDGNLNGRNFWLRSTYEQWKADVLAGRYRQQRRPNPTAREAA
jgi:hypothetical protein